MQSKLCEKIADKASLRNKHNNPIRKRCIKRNKVTKNEVLKLYGINAAGINCKTASFNQVLSQLNPHIWMVEETKLKPHQKIKSDSLNDFQVYYLSRQESHGGGKLHLE